MIGGILAVRYQLQLVLTRKNAFRRVTRIKPEAQRRETANSHPAVTAHTYFDGMRNTIDNQRERVLLTLHVIRDEPRKGPFEDDIKDLVALEQQGRMAGAA